MIKLFETLAAYIPKYTGLFYFFVYLEITVWIAPNCLLVYEMLRCNCRKAVRQVIWKSLLKSKLFSTFFIKSIKIASGCGYRFHRNVKFLRRFACFWMYWIEDQFLWTSNSRKSSELSRISCHFFSIYSPSYSYSKKANLSPNPYSLYKKYRTHVSVSIKEKAKKSLSITRERFLHIKYIWWAHLDLNQGPIGYEPTALTTEL